MTHDQIKAIAEEYAKYVNSAYLSMEAEKEALRVLQFVNDRYCIVEREKVMEVDVNDKARIHRDDVMKTLDEAFEITENNQQIGLILYRRGVLNSYEQCLKDLFDTSMFNQNEE